MASGSQNRRRKHKISSSLDDEELAAFMARLDKAGVTASSFLRCAALDHPLSRATRRPTANHREVARLITEFGNLAQILEEIRDDTYHQSHAPLLDHALSELSDLSLATLQALGKR